MAVKKSIVGQIENRNFLSPTGFQFQLNRAPKVAYFGNQVNIPAMSLGVANVPTYLKDLPFPGEKLEFDDFTLQFLVDENLENYMEIQHWMRGLGFPESLKEIYDYQKESPDIKQPDRSQLNLYSDGTLTVLDSLNIPKFKLIFEGMFPTSLSTIDFDATQTDLEYFVAQVSFKYTIYNIRSIGGDDC
tara:strand:+ start:436 stop:999 length:564 start_codon:yes stop_codon:yes gene_type:complete